MNPFTNRNVPEWLLLCANFEHDENFEEIYEDQKDEPELSHPLYIERLLDDDGQAD